MGMQVDKARHISEESRILLTSLRNGSPSIARGKLAQNLSHLRSILFQQNRTQIPMPFQYPYILPFLDVIIDPGVAGPQTLVALRCIHRMLSQKTIVLSVSQEDENRSNSEEDHCLENRNNPLYFDMAHIVRNILDCRFEQTDQGNDEAVEMAIADLLSLVLTLDISHQMEPDLLMELFNTVFVTRNTFLHSPSLCYHFEQVLQSFVQSIFTNIHIHSQAAHGSIIILDFLISQLLQTPVDMPSSMSKGTVRVIAFNRNRNGSIRGVGGYPDRSSVLLHDNTRVICLKLIRSIIHICFETSSADSTRMTSLCSQMDENDRREFLNLIQDDLCLSLLLMGQSIWTHLEPGSRSLPGMISTEALSEICTTVLTMWNVKYLRSFLTIQFESIFTGFYQRALSLLQSLRFHYEKETVENIIIFDAEVEIILESLVDIFCLNDLCNDDVTCIEMSSLETLFVNYDCNVSRCDVVSGLMIELSRCCGGSSDEGGYGLRLESIDGMSRHASSTFHDSGLSTPQIIQENDIYFHKELLQVRRIPSHIQELCAEVLHGVLSSLRTDQMYHLPTGSHDTHIRLLRKAKEQKHLTHEAARRFNDHSTKGISFLQEHHLISEIPTPHEVAKFLRNGIVFGLDKKSIGEYLGSVGKAPIPAKSLPPWEYDWFHKEALKSYCESFQFKNLSLLDCLRMFLSSFRLPGEAQQIDRIIQAFAESCSMQCEESQNGSLKLFSPNSKKACDAAYLLSFSIIMLQTDLHNKNIKDDRKMKVEDFVKYNTDYGSEITDPGFTFPASYLTDIYDSIRNDKIRTEGEGADGVMTFDRWKDVMNVDSNVDHKIIITDVRIKILILENIWKPIMSAVKGFWTYEYCLDDTRKIFENDNRTLEFQSARLSVDLSITLMSSLKSLTRIDIFEDVFTDICLCTGLVGGYQKEFNHRASEIFYSTERQTAVVAAIYAMINFGDMLSVKCWLYGWLILLELRDLQLLGGKTATNERGIVLESDPDFLTMKSRKIWDMTLVNQVSLATRGSMISNGKKSNSRKGGFLGSLIFRSTTANNFSEIDVGISGDELVSSTNKISSYSGGKDELVIWDDVTSSFDEDDYDIKDDNSNSSFLSIGVLLESLLLKELDQVNHYVTITGVTGLETFDDRSQTHFSSRAKFRRRIIQLFDLRSIFSETRFYEIETVQQILQSLVDIISGEMTSLMFEVQISPASEALLEVWLCEIALKNRDRIVNLWEAVLEDHYVRRLGDTCVEYQPLPISEIPGIEKCCTSLIRLTIHNLHRRNLNSRLLKLMESMCDPAGRLQKLSSDALNFNRHISEGLWRICQDVEGIRALDDECWASLLRMLNFCSSQGISSVVTAENGISNWSDDDPPIQAFRCMHILLHSNELRESIPHSIVWCIRTLISNSIESCSPKLGVAALDLLSVLHARLDTNMHFSKDHDEDSTCTKSWLAVVDGMAEGSNSSDSFMRQHAISLFTDALVDRHINNITIKDLLAILNTMCIPLVQRRLLYLFEEKNNNLTTSQEIMIEIEMCISAIFKPFLQYIKRLSGSPSDFYIVWRSVLKVTVDFLSKESTEEQDGIYSPLPPHLLKVMKDLATEYLHSTLMILITKGIISVEDEDIENDQNITSFTWSMLDKVAFIRDTTPEWKTICRST